MEIKAALIQYNTSMDELERAEKAVQSALQNIKVTAGSSTIEVDGQFFQVRERGAKLYLCELSGKPRGRPAGSKNKRSRKTGLLLATTPDLDLSEPIEGAEALLDAVMESEPAEPETTPAVETTDLEVTGIRTVETVLISSDSAVDSISA